MREKKLQHSREKALNIRIVKPQILYDDIDVFFYICKWEQAGRSVTEEVSVCFSSTGPLLPALNLQHLCSGDVLARFPVAVMQMVRTLSMLHVQKPQSVLKTKWSLLSL